MQCRDLVDAAKKYHLRPDLRPLMQSDSTRVRTGELQTLGHFADFLVVKCIYCEKAVSYKTINISKI